MMTTEYFVKITQGSFHQADEQFGHTAGKQCTCNALFSVVLTIVKSPGKWDSIDIDNVLKYGDELYKRLNIDLYLMFSDLPREIELMRFKFLIEFLDHKVGVINSNSLPGTILDMNSNPQSDGFLLIINEKCISVTWNKRNFFLFDSHSRNNRGITDGEGAASLIKFNSRKKLELFIFENFLNESNENVQFELQHISLSKENNDLAFTNYMTYRKNLCKNNPVFKAKERKRRAQPESIHRRKKQRATPEAKEKVRKYKAIPEVKERVRLNNISSKIKRKINFGKSCSFSQIGNFKKAIKEGPYFICVVCNRCMYRRTVQNFDATKYDLQYSYLFTLVQSFNSKFYICLTCHQNLNKKKVPCQSVWNKLALEDLPEEICHLNRLEKVLISKRILFKKITIMPKGQQPKIKGAICLSLIHI